MQFGWYEIAMIGGGPHVRMMAFLPPNQQSQSTEAL